MVTNSIIGANRPPYRESIDLQGFHRPRNSREWCQAEADIIEIYDVVKTVASY